MNHIGINSDPLWHRDVITNEASTLKRLGCTLCC
jgi:hypothetical protein